MKALVYHGNRDLRLESVPDPEPGDGDVRLRMDYCGICATDVEEYVYGPKFIFHDEPNPLTGKKTPMITGHEITGTVEKLGDGVSGLSVGERVVLDTITHMWRSAGGAGRAEGTSAIRWPWPGSG